MTQSQAPLPHLLIVEDDPDNAQLLEDSLNRSAPAYRITWVASAEAALAEVAQTPYDLVLADYRLPGRDGLELLADLRQVAPALPVLLITGYPTLEVRQRAMMLGVTGFLLKPVTLAALRQAVRDALRE